MDDFDLTDLKKKKKSSKKKAQMDLEAFEKELGDEAKDDDIVGDDAEEDVDLGDDPFAAAEDGVPSVVGINTGKEPWIGSDRDYKYTEVSLAYFY